MFIEPPGSPLLELIEPFFEKRILTPWKKLAIPFPKNEV
jgi:hypothetical protein